jgi:hypothetical protein
VQAILDAHPDIAIAPETHFVKLSLARSRAPGGGAAGVTLLDELIDSDGFRDTGLDATAFRERASALASDATALFSELLWAYGELRGARIVGEKTPNHLLHMPVLERMYPGARFVHVIRDPRGVCHSMRSVPWSKGSAGRDAEMWRRYMEVARRQPPHAPGALHEVRFERLVQDPEPVVRELVRFVGVDFSAGMLEPGDAVAGVDVVREPWKRNVRGAIDPRNADRWRERLSPSEITAVEAVSLGEMRRLGYRPVTPAARLLPRAAYRAARRAVTSLRKARAGQAAETSGEAG